MSTHQSESSLQRDQRQYLAKVLSLSHEVTSSIEAIQYNDLTELQNSVARQEALCRELTAAQLPPLGAHSQSRFGHEIRSAHIELAQQNRLYKAVLKRARKSVGLILAVYQHHGRGYSKDGTSRTDNHTWSCEV